MDQLTEFLLNHWLLSLAALVILTLIAMSFSRDRLLGFKEVKPSEAVRLINHEDAVVLDTRNAEEFADGHILDAVNVPLSELEDRIGELESMRQRPLVVCCRTGQRSARAGSILRRHGFGTIYKLGGGLMSWEGAGFPLAKE